MTAALTLAIIACCAQYSARVADEDTLRRLVLLLLELLKQRHDLPELLLRGAGACMLDLCKIHHRILGDIALEADIFAIANAHLASATPPGDWVLIDRGPNAAVALGLGCWYKHCLTLPPDEAYRCVSGFFEHCVHAVERAFATVTAQSLNVINHNGLLAAITTVRGCCKFPECEKRIRTKSFAKALAFMLNPKHDLDWIGVRKTQGKDAVLLCKRIFIFRNTAVCPDRLRTKARRIDLTERACVFSLGLLGRWLHHRSGRDASLLQCFRAR